MFKGSLTVGKDGMIEGDSLLYSIIQAKVTLDGKGDVELKGSPWCG